MKKILPVLFALVLVVSLCAVSVSATGEEMKVLRGTPTIDGTIDAVWASADRQQLTHLKAGDLKGDGTLPDTSSAYASMLWDDGALYFLFEIHDDDFAFTAAQGAWQNDSLYLYVDEESSYCATWVDGQNQLALIPAEDLSLIPRNGTAPADYDMAYSYPDDNTCIIEFKYVPAIVELKADLELVIDFQYNDSTDAGTRDYCFGWSDETDGASGDSTVWGFVTLSADVAEGGEAASTEAAPAAEAAGPEYRDYTATDVIAANSGAGYATLDEAAASIGKTPINAYTFVSGTGSFNNEGPENLFDNDTTTKFCSGEFPTISVAKLDAPTTIDGVIMATANDNSSNAGRNPFEWAIFVSADGSNWTQLVYGDDTFFEDVDYTYYATAVTPVEGVQYVQFQSEGGLAGCFQMSELVLCGTAGAAPVAETPAEEVEAPAAETPAAETVEAPAAETVEAPAETVAPQTSDVTAVITLGAMVTALCAFAISRRKTNA